MRWWKFTGFPGENLAPATDVTAAEVIHHGNAIGTHPAALMAIFHPTYTLWWTNIAMENGHL